MQARCPDDFALRVGLTAAVATIAAAIAASGCGGDDELVVPEGCNPIASEWDCLLPYPSNFFLVDDASTPSGKRVAVAEAAMPRTIKMDPVDMTQLFRADGFSPLPAIVVYVPFDVDDGNLVFHTGDVEVSLGTESPTVLLDAETGEGVPHFAELDPRIEEGERQGMILRPLVRLEDGRRYVVALRRIAEVGGGVIPAPRGFAMLRDGRASSHPVVGLLADRYESEIFPVLEGAGVDRAELQLAWDFTTATRENLTADMLRVRELAMAAYEATPPAVTVTEVVDDVDDQIARRVRGTIEVPLFVESTEPGAPLVRGADGQVEQAGTAQAEFRLIVPRSLAENSEGARPGRFVQYGHGFFGSSEDIESDFMHGFANRTASVLVAIDWWGMSDADVGTVSGDINEDLGIVLRFVDRVHQAMANQIAVTYAGRETLAALPELAFDGELAYDPGEIYFYGISMGHILGATYLALSPHVERGVLGVGGCGLPHIMFRSRSFGAFFLLINFVMDDPLEQQKFSALGHLGFDRIDPATYAPFVFDAPLLDAPPLRRILMHAGLGDAKVPNLASHLHARMLGLSLLEPAVRPVYGLEPAAAPFDGSALVEFDLGIEGTLPGTYAEMSEDNGVHDDVRTLDASIEQVDRFLRPSGLVEATCDGVCDPE